MVYSHKGGVNFIYIIVLRYLYALFQSFAEPPGQDPQYMRVFSSRHFAPAQEVNVYTCFETAGARVFLAIELTSTYEYNTMYASCACSSQAGVFEVFLPIDIQSM